MIEDQKIAIIGGTGKFGQHMGKLLEDGNEILISGSSEEKAKRIAKEHGWKSGKGTEIVEDADVVMFSVPISLTVDLIHEIGPHIDGSALICDVTSVKENPCEAMSDYSEQVLGMHPMYAPSNPPDGQNIVLCPIKGKKWTMFEEFWMEHGANVHLAEPEEHDRAMSVVQGLVHFSEMVFAETLSRMEKDDEKVEQFSTPIHRIISDMTARMLNQQSELYESIQIENPRNSEMREKFIESANEMADIIGDEDFEGRFEELGEQFDLDESQERSDRIIEFMRSEF